MIRYPTNTRESTNEMRAAIGRLVTFNTKIITECVYSGCSLNPVTETSTNPFCISCSGEYYIKTFSGVNVLAHISWYPEQMQWHPGGQHFDGDVRVQIEYTDANLSTIANTQFIVVDDKSVEIKKTTYRGFPEFNRIILECKEA